MATIPGNLNPLSYMTQDQVNDLYRQANSSQGYDMFEQTFYGIYGTTYTKEHPMIDRKSIERFYYRLRA